MSAFSLPSPMTTTHTPDSSKPSPAVSVGALLVLISATGFSAKAIFVKLAYTYHVDSVTLLALRMLFSLPFFGLMAWWS